MACISAKQLKILSMFAGGLTLLSGCMPNVYRVQRAALVEPPAPPMWSGKIAPSGFVAGNSTVLWKNAPHRDASSDSGLYVSGTQFDAIPHIKFNDHLALWLPVSVGLSPGSFEAAPCLVNRPSNGVWSGGVGVATSFDLSEHWYLGGSFETQIMLVPSHIVAQCIIGETCTPISKEDTSYLPVARASVVSGYDFGPIRVFGGLSFRNHPTNISDQVEVTYSSSGSTIDGDVRIGPLYGMAGLGVEASVTQNVSVLAQLYQPFSLGAPVLNYGFIAGITLDLHGAT